jgi:hypothetical protein
VKGTDNPRFLGRPVVTYGSPNDPGVDLVLVEDTRELRTIVPSLEERSTSKRVWNASGVCQSDFLPSTKLAFSNLAEYTGLPGAAVQITAFKVSSLPSLAMMGDIFRSYPFSPHNEMMSYAPNFCYHADYAFHSAAVSQSA